VIEKSFWKDKKILVTGHTGFKGSWLCLILKNLGARVTGFSLDDPVSKPSMFDLLKLDTVVNDYRGDLRSIDECSNIMLKEQPDVVIHMAAQSLVRKSYSQPVTTFETNVIGTVNILETARNLDSVSEIIVVTSDKCYKNIEKDYSYTEDDSLGGFDPYSSSKACTEHVSSAYYNSFLINEGKGLATVRAGNVIGGGDWSVDRLFPDAVKSFNIGNKVFIRNPSAVRPWQHVLDPLFGYLLLVEKLHSDKQVYSGPWNFGPDKKNCKSVEHVINSFSKMWGDKAAWELFKEDELHEATLLQLSSNKSRKKLGWKPKLGLKNALEYTSDWYKTYYSSKENMYEFTLSQIYKYME